MKLRTPFFVILGSLIVFLVFYFWFHRHDYTYHPNSQTIEDRYYNSSYGRNYATYILSDEELYVVEGHFLVDNLQDLHKLNAGHPPLGKYLIGISTSVLGNPYLLAALFGLASLLVFYKLGLSLSLSPLLTITATLGLTLESLFNEQLSTSLLDVYLIFFLFVSLLLYYLALKNKNRALTYLSFSQLSLGLALATKFFPTSAPLAISLVLITFIKGDFEFFKKHIISLLFVAIGFAIGHVTYFIYHPSVLDFIRYNRYVISWWAGSPNVPHFQVWDLIFNNRWHTWWDEKSVISTPYWWFGWPILFGISIFSPIIVFLRNRITLQYLAIYLWMMLSLLLFSFEAIYPRHLLLALPQTYLITAYIIFSLITKPRKLK